MIPIRKQIINNKQKRVTQKSITTERVTLFHYLSAFP